MEDCFVGLMGIFIRYMYMLVCRLIEFQVLIKLYMVFIRIILVYLTMIDNTK